MLLSDWFQLVLSGVFYKEKVDVVSTMTENKKLCLVMRFGGKEEDKMGNNK